jgi:hypothetical protein
MVYWGSTFHYYDGYRLLRLCSSMGPYEFLGCHSNYQLVIRYSIIVFSRIDMGVILGGDGR